ncbi:phosphate/phosphite/phosphonate ABC transporter substrate-binding protein [Streptomyces sp. 184]|uniref:phosphate/phosphite/phosphonate ABC transporter substrate-binding protein n=1 Tax=Streptomyces sp. 184 TaxID=1827526 RepID=UPI0038913A74
MVRLRAALTLVAFMAVACGGGDTAGDANGYGIPEKLRVGVVPNVAPDRQNAKYEPLRAYLADRLDTEIELFVATDYAGVVTALAAEQIDIAYLGGLTYAQAERKVDVTPLVTETDEETGTEEYLSGIVVRSDSRYESVRDVLDAHGEFAFGDVSSTSGSLYPRMMLNAAGARCSSNAIDQCPPLSEVTFTGGHDATAQAVVNGSADAGGLEIRILRGLEDEGAVPEGDLRIVEKKRVMGYPWVIRDELGGAAATSVTRAFKEMKDPQLLDLMQTSEYREVSESDYAAIRERAEELGLLTTDG